MTVLGMDNGEFMARRQPDDIGDLVLVDGIYMTAEEVVERADSARTITYNIERKDN